LSSFDYITIRSTIQLFQIVQLYIFESVEPHWVDWYLITVCKTAHAAHDTEHVVVGGVHTHRGARGRADRIVGHRQQDRGVINTGQVARAAGLVLLGLQSKGVHVDTNGGHVGVVLEGLHLVEIAALATLEPVVAV